MAEIVFDQSKVSIVEIDKIKPNSWNPKTKDTNRVEFKEVKKSIDQKGLRSPIIVREIGKEEYEIIDGEQRWTACKELEYSKVLIYNEGKVDDQLAQELTIAYQTQVPFTEADIAKLIFDMYKKYESPALPYSENKIEDLRKLAEFDWDKYMNNTIELIDRDKKDGEEVLYVTDEELIKIKKLINYREETEDEQGKARLIIKKVNRIIASKYQFDIIQKALEKVIQENDIGTKGRAMELICADFLNN